MRMLKKNKKRVALMRNIAIYPEFPFLSSIHRTDRETSQFPHETAAVFKMFREFLQQQKSFAAKDGKVFSHS